MICSKCGTNNNEGSKFCIKCGNPLDNNVNLNNQDMNNMQNTTNVVNNNVNVAQPINMMPNGQVVMNNADSMNFMKYLGKSIIKPFQSYAEEEQKFTIKNVSILSLIVVVITLVCSLIVEIIDTVKTTSYSLSGTSSTWNWDNLDDFEWFKFLGKHFLIYAGIILAIACVFYIGSLIVKKEIKFPNALVIAATSVIPMFLCVVVLDPLFSLLSSDLGSVIAIIGVVYTFVEIIIMMNKEIKLEGDIKIYFNLACFSVLLIIAYFIIMHMISSTYSSMLGL